MQEALKNTNTNALELKETINDCITKEKKLKQKIKELEEENNLLINKNHKFSESENA